MLVLIYSPLIELWLTIRLLLCIANDNTHVHHAKQLLPTINLSYSRIYSIMPFPQSNQVPAISTEKQNRSWGLIITGGVLVAAFSGFIFVVDVFCNLPKKWGKTKKWYTITHKEPINVIIKFYTPNHNKNTNYNSLDGVWGDFLQFCQSF